MIHTPPCIPETAPFTAEQRQWLNGFLAGMFSGASVAATEPVTKTPLLILYGSQTGTAEGLAKKVRTAAEQNGFSARVVSMEAHDTVKWPTETNVLIITSTYGDGEPPDAAVAFWQWLSAAAAPRMEHIRYSVLALGDTNYSAFCEFGKKCDARFAELGAVRVHERTDCDTDYEDPSAAWTSAAITALLGSGGAAGGVALPVDGPAAAVATLHDRKNPFPARLLKNQPLSGVNSAKEVRHFEIALAESGLSYEAGDALGIFPENCPAAVDAVLRALGSDGEEAVSAGSAELPLRLALSRHFDITKPSTELIATLANDCAELRDLQSRPADLKAWLHGREVIDLLRLAAPPLLPADFVKLLKKLAPRLYSISSSPKAHPGEVHLTVGIVRYESHGLVRKGVCSTFLADRAGDATAVPVFVQPSHGFKLPADPSVPVIMVGPGTGIAPFRAFLEERRAVGAKGKNWLFFGDQRAEADFLYREQLTGYVEDGHLSRLDLAFSRDQAEKIYVQHRMREQASELWRWLEEGAHFYVCGDASRMAKDVDAMLHEVIALAGAKSAEEAAAYVARLKSAKRYQRDVY